jgi:hypothetical protein
LDIPSTTKLFGGAAIFGVIASGWQYVKMVFTKISSIIIISAEIQGDLSESLSLYFWRKCRRSPFGRRDYRSFDVYIRKNQRRGAVAVEEIGKDPIIFWKGLRPILFGKTNGKENGPDTSTTVTFIRGMWNADALLFEATTLYNAYMTENNGNQRFYINYIFGIMNKKYDEAKDRVEHKKSNGWWETRLRMGIYRLVGLDPKGIGHEFKADDALVKYLAFPPDVMSSIKEAVHWRNSQRWYERRGLPWKRGWLLYGTHGTGKTSLVRALAEYMDLPLYVYDLTSMINESLIEKWHEMLAATPCMALFEDIDNIFHGRENIVNKHSLLNNLTFDCLLNVLDGVEKSDGVFTILTTNKVKALDPALGTPKEGGDGISTRPGRIDRVIELKELDYDCRLKLAKRILIDDEGSIESIVEQGEGDTGAQFQERCARLSLGKHWASKPQKETNSLPEVVKSDAIFE